jgi:hypothetical protein
MLGPANNCVTPPLEANEAVPNKEPVIPFETVREFKVASEPLTIIFFQLGIDKIYYDWLQDCLPTSL